MLRLYKKRLARSHVCSLCPRVILGVDIMSAHTFAGAHVRPRGHALPMQTMQDENGCSICHCAPASAGASAGVAISLFRSTAIFGLEAHARLAGPPGWPAPRSMKMDAGKLVEDAAPSERRCCVSAFGRELVCRLYQA